MLDLSDVRAFAGRDFRAAIGVGRGGSSWIRIGSSFCSDISLSREEVDAER